MNRFTYIIAKTRQIIFHKNWVLQMINLKLRNTEINDHVIEKERCISANSYEGAGFSKIEHVEK